MTVAVGVSVTTAVLVAVTVLVMVTVAVRVTVGIIVGVPVVVAGAVGVAVTVLVAVAVKATAGAFFTTGFRNTDCKGNSFHNGFKYWEYGWDALEFCAGLPPVRVALISAATTTPTIRKTERIMTNTRGNNFIFMIASLIMMMG